MFPTVVSPATFTPSEFEPYYYALVLDAIFAATPDGGLARFY